MRTGILQGFAYYTDELFFVSNTRSKVSDESWYDLSIVQNQLVSFLLLTPKVSFS